MSTYYYGEKFDILKRYIHNDSIILIYIDYIDTLLRED